MSGAGVLSSKFRQGFGSPVSIGKEVKCKYYYNSKTVLSVIRCGKQGKGFVWVGRAAMVGFGGVISVEVLTGKGVLENIGVLDPLPTLVLAITTIVGLLTALFIFQSASPD